MLALVGIACLAGALCPTPVKQTGHVLRHHPPIKIHRQRSEGQWDSTNWSGYAVTGPKKSVSDVKSSWIVPAANCTGANEGATGGYASLWVGIDGWSSNTVEQIGTDSDCVSPQGIGGVPTYYAWFEFYPKPAYYIGNPGNGFSGYVVEPGDVIYAEVKFISGNVFAVAISDIRSGVNQWTFTTSSYVGGAQRTSAEWIAEAPCCQSGGSFLPLANFGAAYYGNRFTNLPNTASATVLGQTGSIGSFGNSVQEVTMVSEGAPGGTPAGTLMAQPSPLTASGSSFSVNWSNWGP
jgi:hypothetical protein